MWEIEGAGSLKGGGYVFKFQAVSSQGGSVPNSGRSITYCVGNKKMGQNFSGDILLLGNIYLIMINLF